MLRALCTLLFLFTVLATSTSYGQQQFPPRVESLLLEREAFGKKLQCVFVQLSDGRLFATSNLPFPKDSAEIVIDSRTLVDSASLLDEASIDSRNGHPEYFFYLAEVDRRRLSNALRATIDSVCVKQANATSAKTGMEVSVYQPRSDKSFQSYVGSSNYSSENEIIGTPPTRPSYALLLPTIRISLGTVKLIENNKLTDKWIGVIADEPEGINGTRVIPANAIVDFIHKNFD